MSNVLSTVNEHRGLLEDQMTFKVKVYNTVVLQQQNFVEDPSIVLYS